MKAIGRGLLVGLGFAVVGCGTASISHIVEDDLLSDVSRQGQLASFDSENEIVAALDKLDDAKDRLIVADRRIREAGTRLERASKQKGRKAGAAKVVRMWIATLGSERTWAEGNVVLAKLGVLVARGDSELTKAKVVAREEIAAGGDFSTEDFKAQAKRVRAAYDAQLERVRELRKAALAQEKKWWNVREGFIAQSGDYDVGLWVD